MRVIKFRAYVKDKNILREVIGAHYSKNEIYLRYGDKNNIIANMEGIELMQYVGLKDSTGTEIYEGDILQDNTGSKFRVVFEGTGFTSYKISKRYDFKYNLKVLFEIAEGLRVIGNIYQNKDLL